MADYIIRLDDACPTMNWEKWQQIFNLLDKYNIKPIVAVIPENKDKSFDKTKPVDNFWDIVRTWERKGYNIAMHGYDHVYISNDEGIVPLNKRSEFAGVDFDLQLSKIKGAWDIFLKNKVKPKIWVAPAHSFDRNTLKILKDNTGIKIVSDGLARYPFNNYGFFWLPLQLWRSKQRENGVWTICYHPNNMTEKQYYDLENFIRSMGDKSFPDLIEIIEKYENRRMSLLDLFFKLSFIAKLKLKHLIFSK